MALIDCPQCKKPISDKARKCPHCGLDMTVPYEPPQPQPQRVENFPKKPRKIWPIITVIAGVIIVGIALWCFVFNDSKTNETPIIDPARKPTELSYKTSENNPASNTIEVNELLNQWVKYHNDKDLTRLAALYDNQVEYYLGNYSNSQVYNSKKNALEKNPQFRMEISNVRIDEHSSYCEVSFDKKVWFNPNNAPKVYPSYLRLNKVNGLWKIIKESDLVTDSYTSVDNNNVSISSARYVVINATELRLRLGPSTSADTFKWSDGSNRHPNKGEKYLYLGESGDFYKINYKGYELWVSKQYTYLE